MLFLRKNCKLYSIMTLLIFYISPRGFFMRFHLFLSSALILALAGINFAQATAADSNASKQQLATETASHAAPAHAPSITDHHLTANRFVLATGVVGHEPQGVKEQFSTHDGHIFAFVDLNSKGNDHVTFRWKKDGKTYYESNLSIKDSPRWRTYTKITAHAGSWSVEILDSHGAVVKEANFTVTAHDPHTSSNVIASNSGQKQPESVKEVLEALEPAKAAKAN